MQYLVTFHSHCMENLGGWGLPAIPDAPLSMRAPRLPSLWLCRGCAWEGGRRAGEIAQRSLFLSQRVGVPAGSSVLGKRWGFLTAGAFVLEGNF